MTTQTANKFLIIMCLNSSENDVWTRSSEINIVAIESSGADKAAVKDFMEKKEDSDNKCISPADTSDSHVYLETHGDFRMRELDNDDLEYCMLTYEVYFPEDFPQADYGITSVDMDFGIENPDGGGIEKDGVAYIGLSSVWDISEAPEINEFYAGDTFTEGKAIFAMVKDVSGYVVESSYPDENDEMVYSYVEGK